jgi:DNA polymerase III delta subunit
MFYLIAGNDTARSSVYLKQLINSFKETEELADFSFDQENFSVSRFNELLKTTPLFSGNTVVVIRRVLADELIRNYFLENIKKISESENIFIFWEDEEVDKNCLKSFEREAVGIKQFNLVSVGQFVGGGQKKELFKIADLIALKEKEKAWCSYQEALLKGIPAEDIFKVIFWQIKVLLLIKKDKNPGLHPFVLRKNKRNSALFETSKLKKFSSDLVELYHKFRSGQTELEFGLEKFILKI